MAKPRDAIITGIGLISAIVVTGFVSRITRRALQTRVPEKPS